MTSAGTPSGVGMGESVGPSTIWLVLAWTFDIVFVIQTVFLFLYGAQYWFMSISFWFLKAGSEERCYSDQSYPPAPPERLEPYLQFSDEEIQYPKVLIQLPVFNEGAICERLLSKCLELEYPTHALVIQLLDDSTDNTPELVKQFLALVAPTKFRVEHVRRENRVGYKAGALREGMRLEPDADFIAIFDADFMPEPDFLAYTLPYFYNDKHQESPYYKDKLCSKGVACVQARWDFTNRYYNLMTYIQAVALDGHFMIEQRVRTHLGYYMHFNGTGGVWRREAIEDAGGWSQDTLAEDLDLSFRAQFRGWQMVYVNDVLAPNEIPPTVSAFKKQQYRWAKGSFQCVLKHLGNVWRQGNLSLWRKYQCTIHLAGYFINLIMTLATLTSCVLFWYSDRVSTLVGNLTPILIFVGLGPTAMYFTCILSKKIIPWMEIATFPLLVLLGYGMAYNDTLAVLEGSVKKGGEFVRTEKYGLVDGSGASITMSGSSARVTNGSAKSVTPAPTSKARNALVTKFSDYMGATGTFKSELVFSVVVAALLCLHIVLNGVSDPGQLMWVSIFFSARIFLVALVWHERRQTISHSFRNSMDPAFALAPHDAASARITRSPSQAALANYDHLE
ncbi:glycosyltransferase [Thecamonas trahens ATCC 50062]|uniref:Glucomannan synthase n=1 Tax=Thecamonas trahens ATCC 50062 TaxID=461836 RepID=A0A0L0DFK0_THETB|nr:glycosyltransferase [Thecamonas trahens ATCC 50062]KNC51059.1 glycosyltransferase [Thecamonas trahens ATCC 50062]|eukprot:XP_013756520.1 glycosyltransferase [Thecamonas trahens ATCC 50062]